MAKFEQFSKELATAMRSLQDICYRHGFKASPCIVLMHERGPKSSIVMGNDNLDNLDDVAECIRYVSNDSKSHEKYIVVPDDSITHPKGIIPKSSMN